MSEVHIPSQEVVLTADKPRFRMILNTESTTKIPINYDISGIDFTFPNELKEVRIYIGKQLIAEFDHDTKDQLSNFPLYLSLCRYMYTEFEFVYCETWLAENEQYVFEDEYTEIEEYGDEMEVFDGDEYHYGRAVYRKNVPTGGTVRKIVKGVTVAIPSITFHIVENDGTLSRIVPVPQKLKLADLDDEYKQILISKYDMKVYNDYGIVMNKLRYAGNMAGLMYVFG